MYLQYQRTAHQMLRNSIAKLRAKTVASGLLVDEVKNKAQMGASGSKQNNGYVT